MRVETHGLLLTLCIAPGLIADAPAQFEKAVRPVLANTCIACHNDRVASGGLNLNPLLRHGSIAEQRDEWDRVLQKIRTGEMPPKDVPRPPEDRIEALMRFVKAEFEKADRNIKPDPGRVTARRLNRSEYTNTIRDLLGVDYRAEKDFPTDDSGHGFDNIGDVLTISPVLMEKYLAAAERIAARAIGAAISGTEQQSIFIGLQKRRRRSLLLCRLHLKGEVEISLVGFDSFTLAGNDLGQVSPIPLLQTSVCRNEGARRLDPPLAA
jgi:hypothetical protein